jgi:DNA polymerase V
MFYLKKNQHLKVSAMFSALHAKAQRSDDLRQPIDKIQQRDQLMNAFLQMKGEYGADCIQAGYSSAQQAWKMKQEQRSPRYAACRNQLLQVD